MSGENCSSTASSAGHAKARMLDRVLPEGRDPSRAKSCSPNCSLSNSLSHAWPDARKPLAVLSRAVLSAPVFVKDIQQNFKERGHDLVIVSPDVGGVVRARAIAKRLEADLAIIDKRRERAGVSEVMNIIGDVDGRTCILVDDIVDSAGTLCNAAEALRKAGATSVSAYVTHGVLSGGAVARVTSSPLQSLVITDSIQATEAVRLAQNIRQLTIAPLMAEAIKRISEERSVSSLFD